MEHEEQKTLFTLIRAHEQSYPVMQCIFAVPNGGLRNVSVAVKLKAEGVKAGVWDICVPCPRNGFTGLWVEMKYGKNKLTERQKDFESSMRANGWATAVCWTWQEAAQEIFAFLNIPLNL